MKMDFEEETFGSFRYFEEDTFGRLPDNENTFVFTYPDADNTGYRHDILSQDRSSKHQKFFRNGYIVTEPEQSPMRRKSRLTSERERQRNTNRKSVEVANDRGSSSRQNSETLVPNERRHSESDCSNYLSAETLKAREERWSASVLDGKVPTHKRDTGKRNSDLAESDDGNSSESQGSSSSTSNENLDFNINNDLVEVTRSGPKGSPMSISFSGAGFLGVYHLGVATALVKHGRQFLNKVQKFMGASAGSLVAANMVIYPGDLQTLQQCTEFCILCAEMVRSKRMGILDPSVNIMEPLKEFLEKVIPEDGHLRANGKLCISVTNRKTKKNELISHFETRDHLIKYLMGSSCIPKVTGKRPIEVDGKVLADGGFTDNLPRLDDGRTVRVSPYEGSQDICPLDKHSRGLYRHVNNRTIRVNLSNAKRQMHSFFPPNQKGLRKYFARGEHDAILFLKKENIFEEVEDNGEDPHDPFLLRHSGSVRSIRSINSDSGVNFPSKTSSVSNMSDISDVDNNTESEESESSYL